MITKFIFGFYPCIVAVAQFLVDLLVFLLWDASLVTAKDKVAYVECTTAVLLVMIFSLVFGILVRVLFGIPDLIDAICGFFWKLFKRRERRISPPVLTSQQIAQLLAEKRL